MHASHGYFIGGTPDRRRAHDAGAARCPALSPGKIRHWAGLLGLLVACLARGMLARTCPSAAKSRASART
jgi:hypothetical protein